LSPEKSYQVSTSSHESTLFLVVLDTNVLLDWLIFRNPALLPLADALAEQRLQWVATEAMREEMAHVLARGVGERWTVDEAHWQGAWARHARLLPEPVAPLTLPRCSDPDDQKFIELAITARARWLLTRDRALLKLARRAQGHGVEILTPERWNEAAAALIGR
jgi:putative PIN family toxin of toxin-antitoxin system